jgi:citrate lyase subunit beta/citryl-CoA lyase
VAAPLLTWLYVPATRPDRVGKAIASRAHAVIVDLEDGVAPDEKDAARAAAVDLLREPREKPVFLRVNPGSRADLEAAAQLSLAGVILPKVDRPEDVPDVPVHAMLETARAVEAAFEIAAHPNVVGVSLGEADLRSGVGALEEGMDWWRSRIVNASVAAGHGRPRQAVYMHPRDLDGLARSCRRGRELGHLGREAIHPDQLPVIERAYLPSKAEVDAARETLEHAGPGQLADGSFVDAAVFGSARLALELASAYGVA